MEFSDYILQGAAVIGFTAVIGKLVPAKLRNVLLPLVALLAGVAVFIVPLLLPSQTELLNAVLLGIAVGGASTGLYAVTKEVAKVNG